MTTKNVAPTQHIPLPPARSAGGRGLGRGGISVLVFSHDSTGVNPVVIFILFFPFLLSASEPSFNRSLLTVHFPPNNGSSATGSIPVSSICSRNSFTTSFRSAIRASRPAIAPTRDCNSVVRSLTSSSRCSR